METWKTIEYEDIVKDKYEVSDKGRIRNKSTLKILKGNNPKNEQGYVRVCLKTYNGRKKFPVHRLVMYMFSEDHRHYLEVNHKIPGYEGKRCNSLENLEYMSRLENAGYAVKTHMYHTCEDHHKALFTNEEVHQICKYFSEGISMNKVIKLMGFQDIEHIDAYISRIKNRESWTEISCLYEWDNDEIIYKTYKKHDIERMCKFIFIEKIKISIIVEIFPQYNRKKLKNVLKKIKQGKLYKSISSKYINQDESSTTIDGYLNINIKI